MKYSFIGGMLSGFASSFFMFYYLKLSSHSYERAATLVETSRASKITFGAIRLVCLIPTLRKNHLLQSKAVKDTWGRRCHRLIFLSDTEDKTLPSVMINVTTGRKYLWGKTKATLKYAYSQHLKDKAHWFLKADDDTYVVVDNLLHFLSRFDHHKPTFIGCQFSPFTPLGFMSGGAGYLLSSSALEIFVKHSERFCEQSEEGDEDVILGKCMFLLNVTFVDGRDSTGKPLFLPMKPGTHLRPGAISPNSWFYNYSIHPVQNNANCCSDRAVSFHFIDPDWMYALEYLIYRHRIA